MNLDIKSLITYEDNEIMIIESKLPSNDSFESTVMRLIKQAFSIKNERDVLIVSIPTYDQTYKIEKNYIASEIKQFIQNVEQFRVIEDSDDLKMECKYYKNIVNNSVSLYSIDAYSKYLNGLSLENILGKFNEIYRDYPYLIFDLIFDVGSFYTKRFYFFDRESNKETYSIVNRMDVIEKQENLCNFISTNKTLFIPDDFHLISSPKNEKMKQVFDKLSLLLALVFISNISDIKDNLISYKIEGYKTINDSLDMSLQEHCEEVSHALWEIYDWIYGNLNNVSDKLGIARNILSLNLNNSNKFEINSAVAASIRSGYEIYLKESAERYIEVVNQQLIFINEINSSIQDLASDFSKKFSKNFIGFFSFIFTTIVFNIISTGTINNIFTYEISMICKVLIIISFIYLIFSQIEVHSSKRRIKNRYDRNKKFYELILDTQDLNRILDNDSYYKEDNVYLKNHLRMYSIFWIITIIVINIFLNQVGTFTK